jgi:hypothetical protein
MNPIAIIQQKRKYAWQHQNYFRQKVILLGLLLGLLLGCYASAERYADTLAATDYVTDNGYYYDVYGFTLEKGEAIVVDVTSSDFGPNAAIFSPSGELIEGNAPTEIGRYTTSIRATEAGLYSLGIMSRLAGATGAYELNVETYAVSGSVKANELVLYSPSPDTVSTPPPSSTSGSRPTVAGLTPQISASEELEIRDLEKKREDFLDRQNNLRLEVVGIFAQHPEAALAASLDSDTMKAFIEETIAEEYQDWVRLIGGVAALAYCFDTFENLGECVSVNSDLEAAQKDFEYFDEQLAYIDNRVGHRLYVQNTCKESVQLVIQYKDHEGTWRVAGWYTFEAGAKTRLENDGVTVRSKENTVYFYAKTTNSEWYGDDTLEFQGETLYLQRWNFSKLDEDSNYPLVLSCSD